MMRNLPLRRPGIAAAALIVGLSGAATVEAAPGVVKLTDTQLDPTALFFISFDGLVNLINSAQPVKGFYAGFHQADFAWLAQPSVKTWADLKGGTIGVSTFGSLTDALTRYVLRKHALAPETDVRIMQAGPSATSIQMLRSGRLLAAIQSAPTKWVAQDLGGDQEAMEG